MTDAQFTRFHQTRMGVKFYERAVLELVRQIAALNETLKAMLERLESADRPE